jgi:hypothetical protein
MTPEQLARRDIAKHHAHGVDLNPFSTTGARYLWVLGFTGQPRPADLHPESTYARYHARGRACALFLKAPS